LTIRSSLLALVLAAAGGAALAAGQPRLVVREPFYDFGTLTPDHPVAHRFLLTNAGDAELLLGEPWVQCNCTSFSLERQVLAPGASTWLTVTFTPTGERGHVERTVQVVSDDPLAPEQPVRYQAEVLDGVMRSGEDLVFHGLDGAGLARGSVTLRMEGMAQVRLMRPPVAPVPWIKVATREEDHQMRVLVTLDGRRLPPGQTSGTETVPLVVATAVPTVVRLKVHWDRQQTGPAAAAAGRQPPVPVAAVRP